MQWSYAPVLWGVVLSVLSSVFTSLGLFLQKWARRDAKSPSEITRSPFYVAGLTYVAVGMLIKLAVYALLPLLSLTVLSSQTIIYSLLLDRFGTTTSSSHSESDDRVTALSVGAVTLGLLLVLLGSNLHSDIFEPIAGLWSSLWTRGSIAFTIVMIIALLGGSEALRRHGHIPPFFRLLFSCCVAAFVAGIFGTFLRMTCIGWAYHLYLDRSSLTGGLTLWITTIITVLAGLAKLQTVKNSLTDYSTAEFLPVYQSCSLVMSILCSTFYLHEWPATRFHYNSLSDSYSGSSTLYVLGVVLVSTGVMANYLRTPEGGDDHATGQPEPEPALLRHLFLFPADFTRWFIFSLKKSPMSPRGCWDLPSPLRIFL